MEISLETQNEIADFIKEKTGAAAFFIALCNEQIPCLTEMSMGQCMTPHKVYCITEGIRPDYFKSFLGGAVDNLTGYGKEKDTDE